MSQPGHLRKSPRLNAKDKNTSSNFPVDNVVTPRSATKKQPVHVLQAATRPSIYELKNTPIPHYIQNLIRADDAETKRTVQRKNETQTFFRQAEKVLAHVKKRGEEDDEYVVQYGKRMLRDLRSKSNNKKKKKCEEARMELELIVKNCSPEASALIDASSLSEDILNKLLEDKQKKKKSLVPASHLLSRRP